MLATDWIQARSSGAPPALVVRVMDVLRGNAQGKSVGVAESLLRAGEQLLASATTPRTGEAREAALDLLAADACVTWAFEAAADEPGTLAQRAEDAMRRITALAAVTK